MTKKGWNKNFIQNVMTYETIESSYNAGDPGSILGLARSPGEGSGYPLRYSGLVNSMDSMGSQRVGNMTKLLLSLFFHQVLNELIQVNC